MNTDVKCSIIEASSNELLYQIEVHNGLIPAYIVKKHDSNTIYSQGETGGAIACIGTCYSQCGTTTNNSYEVTTEEILRAASVAARKSSARLPDSQFLRALGTDDVPTAPPQTRALSLG